MPKRPVDDNIETAIQAAGIKDNDWMQKLLEVDKDQLILIISQIINKNNTDHKSIKRAQTKLPSFSLEKWIDFSAQAGLPEDPSYFQLEYFDTPVHQLPPSFHKAIFENSWHVQDVYQETVEQPIGESRLRILDPYIVPILALFQGRVIDKPEQAMPDSEFTTGGEVEHKVIMMGGILFLVVEAKGHPSNNMSAQLFLELLSAARTNQEADFEGLRVYGILTNLTRFTFYYYDPISSTCCRDDEIFIETLRDGFSSDMIHITNKIFGLVLFAYIGGLRATVEKIKQEAAEGDLSIVGSSVQITRPPSNPHSKPRFSKGKRSWQLTEGWELALVLAEDCRQKFMEKVTTIEEMEIRSTEALELLTKSVCSIARFSEYTTRYSSNCLTPAELKDLACQTVESTLQASLS